MAVVFPKGKLLLARRARLPINLCRDSSWRFNRLANRRGYCFRLRLYRFTQSFIISILIREEDGEYKRKFSFCKKLLND